MAYHHAGLTMDERKLLEEAYRTGVLVVVRVGVTDRPVALCMPLPASGRV